MEYVALAVLYLISIALFGFGVYAIRRGTFPSWAKGWMLWPLIRVTPSIARLQGWSAIAFCVAAATFGSAAFTPTALSAFLLVVSAAGYAAGVALFIYSAWLSRRAAPGAVPPAPVNPV